MSGYDMKSPISCDWDSCKLSMGSIRSERLDLGEVIEVIGLGVEA